MQHAARPTPYKRIFVRRPHVVNWRRLAVCLLAALVILVMVIGLVLALL